MIPAPFQTALEERLSADNDRLRQQVEELERRLDAENTARLAQLTQENAELRKELARLRPVSDEAKRRANGCMIYR